MREDAGPSNVGGGVWEEEGEGQLATGGGRELGDRTTGGFGFRLSVKVGRDLRGMLKATGRSKDG